MHPLLSVPLLCLRPDDVFHCHPDWPGLWLRALPLVHRIYRAVPKPAAAWDERTQPMVAAAAAARSHSPGAPGVSMWGAKVAVHVRLGDVNERALPVGFFARAIESLRRELTGSSGRAESGRGGGIAPPPLFRLQTNGLPTDVAMMRKHYPRAFGRPDVVADYSRYSAEVDSRTSLGLAFHRMVTADVLVMSRSALSMAAALLSNGTIVFPKCWEQFRRPLPHWRLLDCCANASEAVKGANCLQEGRKWRLTRGEKVKAG